MTTQVGVDEFSFTMLDAVIDYRKDKAFAVPKANIHVVTPRGQKKLSKTTIERSLLFKWTDSY